MKLLYHTHSVHVPTAVDNQHNKPFFTFIPSLLGAVQHVKKGPKTKFIVYKNCSCFWKKVGHERSKRKKWPFLSISGCLLIPYKRAQLSHLFSELRPPPTILRYTVHDRRAGGWLNWRDSKRRLCFERNIWEGPLYLYSVYVGIKHTV